MAQEAELVRMRLQLDAVFTPNAPVSDKDSFQGRAEEIERVIAAVLAKGAHAVIFGERGVGKTSLAGLIQEFWTDIVKSDDILVARVNCDPQDDYTSIWAHVADDLLSKGTLQQAPEFVEMLLRMADGEADASLVRRCFGACASTVVVIIDEFDRLQDDETTEHFADVIKGLSDYGVDTTLVAVGVADTIDDLIASHASVDRNLHQILLPRLGAEETWGLVTSRYEQIGLKYEERAVRLIARLAQGLPYYAHLLGKSSASAALRNRSQTVSERDVSEGLRLATEATQESVKASYHDAVSSTRRESIHANVLLACALAERDGLGYFTASGVHGPLANIEGRPIAMTRYLQYLNDFSGVDRGNVLKQEGMRWRKRYRFRDPLLEIYVALKGLEEGVIAPESLAPLQG